MTSTWGWLVLLCPLVGTVVIGLSYKRLKGTTAGWLGTATIALSFAFSVAALISLLSRNPAHREVSNTLWNYAVTTGVDAKLQILVDPLSVFMILVVSGVSTLIHLYSISYLKSDHGYSRYFAYLNFFVMSMLLLVLAGNFFLLIIGWAFVGAASYLLISFWYRRNTATKAGIKAFVINVVGDVGLVIGTFIILKHTGTVDFLGTFAKVHSTFGHDSPDIVAACLLLGVGAFAKSAQVPLHTWLPDAMEGPTPVSALIHAATMVTAGVYLIARMHPLFEQAPTAADVTAIGGCLTLLIAGTIAITQTDLKRVIAYSTMSQIGYMIMAVSAGAYSAGLFHLMTHAFFKALLFMAAGSIIGAMAGVQNLDKMSGFRRAMPFTFAAFIIGGLALSGLPPFSGWLSKDDIIAFLNHRGGGFEVMGILGYVGALITGVYTFRMIFRAFFGEPCPEAAELEHGHLAHADVPTNPMTGEPEDTDVGFPGPEHHIAEQEWPMKVAMGTLGLLAIVGGAIQIPGVDDGVTRFLSTTFADSHLARAEPSHSSAWIGLVIGAVIAVIGITIAYRIWVQKPSIAVAARERFKALYTFLYNKWYFDELIDVLIVRPVLWFGRFADSVLERVVVGEGITGGATGAVRAASAIVRRAQTGFLRFYAAAMIVSLAGVALYFLITSTCQMTLSILIWLPLATSIVAAQLPRKWIGWGASLGSLATMGVAISFLARFDTGHSGLQFLTDKVWIGALGIHYKLGVDGLNVALIMLTTILFSASLIWASFREWDRPAIFYFNFGLAQSAVLGAFCAQDLALFVGFFDLMLVPFYFLIGIWGQGPDRIRATQKLVIYTLVGSFLMLVAAIATGVLASEQHGTSITFVLSALKHLPLSKTSQEWIFLCFAAAFLVKMPLVPFHGWLADGYKAMPTPAVAVFSGILSKVAAYGFLRIVLPLFPAATVHFQMLMLVIALASILYATSIAFTTNEARLVVAYSSIAQLGFITLGIFSLKPQGAQGAILQMVNHGLVTAPLFFIVAALAARTGGSEDLREMGGIAFRAPVLAALFLIVALATLAMPGSANFAGEFLILFGVFKAKLAISIIAFAGVVGAAVYALRVFIGSMHDRVGPRVSSREIGVADLAVLVPLVGVILVLAFYPQFLLKRSQTSTAQTIAPAQLLADSHNGWTAYAPLKVAKAP